MLNIARITNLPAAVGYTWKQLVVLAALGMAIGLVLALATTIPVS